MVKLCHSEKHEGFYCMVPSLTPGKSYYIKAWVSEGVEIVESSLSWAFWEEICSQCIARWYYILHPTPCKLPTQASCQGVGLFSTYFIDENAGLRWPFIPCNNVEVAAGNKELRTTSKLIWYSQQQHYVGDKKLIVQFFQDLPQPSHKLVWKLPKKLEPP